ncbi:hypothetical protein [Mycobacterium sp. OAE908]|uniref:hypothetical protein n=1 Tax=Mycobacterium sp. OAE908 TaxID=2817899 RepID=UPI001AE69D45
MCLAVLSAGLAWWFNRPETKVEIVSLDVVPGADAEGPLKPGGVYEMIPPKIRVTLRNIGDQVSVMTGAELEVLDYAHLPQCWPGAGPIAVSQAYNAVLPRDPRPHDKIAVDVAQEIAPNGTDRFEFALQLANPEDANGIHFYQLKVSLIRDGSHKMDAGIAVVGAPEVYEAKPSPVDLAAPGEIGECFGRLASDYERVQQWQGKGQHTIHSVAVSEVLPFQKVRSATAWRR